MLIKYDIALFPLSFLGGLQEQQHASPKPDVSVLFLLFFCVPVHAFMGSEDIEILCAQEAV